MKIISAESLCIAGDVNELPPTGLAEVAFMGRSNSGKSTLLNRLTGRKRLARTSAAPGRTQAVHLYRVSMQSSNEMSHTVVLADLPGYGYAKLSKVKRDQLAGLLDEYLRKRAPLAALCILIDCRRVPEQEELALQETAFRRGCHVIPVATKIDKLNQKELHRSLKAIASAFRLEPGDILTAGENKSAAVLWERILTFAD
jgi:GTP-binding protein